MQCGGTANGLFGVLLTVHRSLFALCCSHMRGFDLQGACETNAVKEPVQPVHIKGMELDFISLANGQGTVRER